MDFQLGRMSLYICCTLFQESELPMRTDLKLYVFLLCPKKNWKSVLYSMFMTFVQFDSVNSWGLFLHAVICSLNTDSFHIWKIKGIFSTIFFHYVFLYYFFLSTVTFQSQRHDIMYYTFLSPCAYLRFWQGLSPKILLWCHLWHMSINWQSYMRFASSAPDST